MYKINPILVSTTKKQISSKSSKPFIFVVLAKLTFPPLKKASVSLSSFTLIIEEKDSVCKDISYFEDESNLSELIFIGILIDSIAVKIPFFC